MPRPLTLESTANCLACALAAATLLVLLAAFYFAQPTADDFAKAANGRLGIVHTFRYAYFELGGRWSTNLLQAIVFSRVPLLHVYPLLLLAHLAFLGFAHYRLFAALGRPVLSTSFLARATLLFLLIFWTCSEHVGDTFFWLTGGVEYLANAAIALLLLAALLAPAPSIAHRVWSALLALYLGGSHELIVLALVLVLAAGTWSLRERDEPRARSWLVFAAILAVLLITMIASPGAFHRATVQDGSLQPVRAIVFTAVRFLTDLPGWLLQAPVLFATLWIATDSRLGTAIFGSWEPTPRVLAYSAALLSLLVGLTIFIPTLALGGYAPPRTITLACLELLLGWFLLVAMAASIWDLPVRFPAATFPHLRPALPVLLCAALFFSPACQSTARTVVFAAPAWSRAVHLRYLDLQRQAAAGERHAVALPVPATPPIYFDYTLDADPKASPNRVTARYFGFESIKMPSAEKPVIAEPARSSK